jgi:3-methyladenine DNA glycosylase Mpg
VSKAAARGSVLGARTGLSFKLIYLCHAGNLLPHISCAEHGTARAVDVRGLAKFVTESFSEDG